MVFSQITSQPGEVISISLTADYIGSPLSAFKTLTEDSDHSVLLESAEINSKHNLKSLMVIDTAVTFTCYGSSVHVEATNPNGNTVVRHLTEHFANIDEVAITVSSETLLQLKFLAVENNQTEEQRLKQKNSFEALRAAITQIKADKNHPFALFLAGSFAYDMLANFEHLPEVAPGKNTTPDYIFYLAQTLVVIDHQNKSTEIIGNVFTGEDAYVNCFSVGKRIEDIKQSLQGFTPKAVEYGFDLPKQHEIAVDVSDETFAKNVVELKNNIVAGDIFQIVPSRCFSLPCHYALDAYRHLKKDNPSPYMFFLKHPEFELFGASPESALKFDSSNRQVEVYPIAGTRKRGFNSDGSINNDLDSRIELELRQDQKEVAEHMMLVDLARNDIARISEPGSRHVKELLKVDRYSYVMHLVSRVVGTLREDLDALHAYQACMNMGTLVGAPKIKAASLIREVEQQRRGSYGGAVGYLNGLGDMDSCIVIRSAFVQNNTAYIQAGAGVVFDSDPKSEADETFNKAQAVLRAVQASEALLAKESK